jgi:hypothetical protein
VFLLTLYRTAHTDGLDHFLRVQSCHNCGLPPRTQTPLGALYLAVTQTNDL